VKYTIASGKRLLQPRWLSQVTGDLLAGNAL
jgi:hypothetical protein